jgi:transposase InsO family protein
MDVFSRKIVGWQVHETESSEISSQLLTKICREEGVEKNSVTSHSDNGSPMKAATMLATMQRLGVIPSFSRPSVSNDNPFSESLFRTMKYCPQYPSKPFETIKDATQWVSEFVSWYNTQCLHSAISFTTPDSRHRGADQDILKGRDDVYKIAKQKNPQRWSCNTRNWKRVESVRLNWLKEKETSGRSGSLAS